MPILEVWPGEMYYPVVGCDGYERPPCNICNVKLSGDQIIAEVMAGKRLTDFCAPLINQAGAVVLHLELLKKGE